MEDVTCSCLIYKQKKPPQLSEGFRVEITVK
jgi:hypothetical protein